MNGAGRQSQGKTLDAKVRTPKHDVTRGRVVREHADDGLAVKQLGNVCCWTETQCRELVHLIGTTDIRDHSTSGRGKVCGHRRAHVTKTDKADLAMHGPATIRSRAALLFAGLGLGCSGPVEGGYDV